MNKKSLILLAAFLLSGCVTSKGPDLIQQDYESVVFNDGITVEEAIFIAKKEAKDKTHPKEYLIEEPKVVTEFENVPHHEDYWFVSFPESDKSSVTNVYMVAMQKNDGKIVLSRNYVPENEWVLQAVFLKLYEKQKNIDPR